LTTGTTNLDEDGTCISPTSPATGSPNGTTADGSSTYGAVLDAYLADGLANNGGSTATVALLNTPNPSTTLADPAFAVVPASFNLPVAVDGVGSACSVPDQRGVASAAGANCDVGAYLLQATTTALITPSTTVGQNASVTYTATVTPARHGGTVSFNDGAGNPATAKCAARSLSSGTATCTLSYANSGAYPVTATYSGDGAMNNYAASASTTQTVVVAAGPSVHIAAPATGTRVKVGQRLTASYSCQDAPNGPGIQSCAGPVASGAPVDTSRAGTVRFTVTATSKDGQSSSHTTTYMVVGVSRPATSNQFRSVRVVTRPNGVVTVRATFPGPGRADVLETGWISNEAKSADEAKYAVLQPAHGRFVFSRARFTVRRAGTLQAVVQPNARGRRLIRHHTYRVTIRLWLTFTPSGGRSRSEGIYGLHFAP
jgi:hypothetical protein